MRQATEMGPTTRYKPRRNTASIMKVFLMPFSFAIKHVTHHGNEEEAEQEGDQSRATIAIARPIARYNTSV